MRKPRSEYPSEKSDKFLVRLPEGMRERIAQSAKESGRSMNAEIVQRLEISFEAPMIRQENRDGSNVMRPMTQHQFEMLVRVVAENARNGKWPVD